MRVPVGDDEPIKVHLFVATLGYSRRTYVAMFLHEHQSAWLRGLEVAFRHFSGPTREVLVANARVLVNEHDAQTREVAFNGCFPAFCRYWGVTPRSCARIHSGLASWSAAGPVDTDTTGAEEPEAGRIGFAIWDSRRRCYTC